MKSVIVVAIMGAALVAAAPAVDVIHQGSAFALRQEDSEGDRDGSSEAPEERIGWAFGRPQFISSTGPYVAHVEFQVAGMRTIRAQLLDSKDDLLGETEVVESKSRKMSLTIDFNDKLVVGEEYRVHAVISDMKGEEIDETQAFLTAVEDSVKFADAVVALPAEQEKVNLTIIYSCSERRSVVVAVKNPEDSEYQGSARIYVEPGEEVTSVVPLTFRGAGGVLADGQEVILRVDIRPEDALASLRYDRDEINLVAEKIMEYDAQWIDKSPSTISSCKNAALEGNVRYSGPEGPLRLYIVLRNIEGKYVVGRFYNNLAAGEAELPVKLPLRNRVEKDEKYIVSLDLRPQARSTWRDKLVDVRSSALKTLACDEKSEA
mmetsp:Transcript_351/g.1180  ORF Transcript_351/g.1180 Transcript_351/m.1180 type:complete len:376 (+) Transcript_351:158-1285(+)